MLRGTARAAAFPEFVPFVLATFRPKPALVIENTIHMKQSTAEILKEFDRRVCVKEKLQLSSLFVTVQ